MSSNKFVLKYLFSIALRKEVIEYFDNEYFHGYAHIEKAIILLNRLADKEGVILDVGGADGRTAKIFTGAFPGSSIIVFEPIEENYRKIEQITEENKHLSLIKKAAGSENISTVINKAGRITSSSLYALNPDPSSSIFSSDLELKGRETVEVVTLDSVISAETKVNILKIDVQGYELEVLKGAERTLKGTKIIITEMNNHNVYKGAPKYFELDDFLRKRGFELYDLFPSTKDNGRLKEWDAIYIREGIGR